MATAASGAVITSPNRDGEEAKHPDDQCREGEPSGHVVSLLNQLMNAGVPS